MISERYGDGGLSLSLAPKSSEVKDRGTPAVSVHLLPEAVAAKPTHTGSSTQLVRVDRIPPYSQVPREILILLRFL